MRIRGVVLGAVLVQLFLVLALCINCSNYVCHAADTARARSKSPRRDAVSTESQELVEITITATKSTTTMVPSSSTVAEQHRKWSWLTTFWGNSKELDHKNLADTSVSTHVALESSLNTQHQNNNNKALVANSQKNKPTNKKQKRPKNGRQKMADCRHLARDAAIMAGGNSPVARLKRLWRRIVHRHHNQHHHHHHAAAAAATAVDMNVAYGMAIMATLSYWDFHKKLLPHNTTTLEIVSYQTGVPLPLVKRRSKRARSLGWVVSSLQLALDQAQPWLSLIPTRTTRLPQQQRQRQRQRQRRSNTTTSTAVQPSRKHNKNNHTHKQWWQSMNATISTINSHDIQTTLRELRHQLVQSLDQYYPRPNHQQYKRQQQQTTNKRPPHRHGQHQIQLHYSLYNWYEPTPLGNYHDTDLIIATSNHGHTLILAFAGTASVPDTVTNLQTFEPAQHSGFFSVKDGSIHRGFLNSYSRVERGSILRLCQGKNCTLQGEAASALYHRYGHCTVDEIMPSRAQHSTAYGNAAGTNTDNKASFDNETMSYKQHAATMNNNTIPTTETITWKRGRGCKIKNRKLMTILRELVTDYLSAGKTVHLTGHSLGGSIASIHALDLIINFPHVPVTNLHLWTFGGAQVSDDAFLQSALQVAPRLKYFLQHKDDTPPSTTNHNSNKKSFSSILGTPKVTIRSSRSRFHRFVTVSDDCKVDFVSTVAQKTLAPDNDRNIHGKTARKLGGILGTSVVHLTEPYYLLTPEQYDYQDDIDDVDDISDNQHNGSDDTKRPNKNATTKKKAKSAQPEQDSEETGATPSSSAAKQPSSTRSSLSAHSTSNYIKGISRESKDHPLSTDLPLEVRKFLGEMMV